jgi:hypothetical protein
VQHRQAPEGNRLACKVCLLAYLAYGIGILLHISWRQQCTYVQTLHPSLIARLCSSIGSSTI